MIHWTNKTALYEAMNICTIHEVDILKGHTNSWDAWICYYQSYDSKLETPQRDLIHCIQQQWQGHRGGRTNIQWKHNTPYLIWHFLATLAAYICVLASQATFTSYDTTGTVVTQTYITSYEVVRLTIPRGQWWHKRTLLLTIPRWQWGHEQKGITWYIQPLIIPREQSRRQWWGKRNIPTWDT